MAYMTVRIHHTKSSRQKGCTMNEDAKGDVDQTQSPVMGIEREASKNQENVATEKRSIVLKTQESATIENMYEISFLYSI